MSKGSLQGNFGDCLAKKINESYGHTSPHNTNYIKVDVDVTQTGRYTIYTDTVNRYSGGIFKYRFKYSTP